MRPKAAECRRWTGIDALKKLGELHDSGVLTDDQFDAEKEKLI